MSIPMTLTVALRALRRNAMRTSLTALGLIIGVAAVIVMVALGGGARASIQAQIRSAGSNIIVVTAGSGTFGPVRQGSGAVTTLVPGDAEALGEAVAGIRFLTPGINLRTQIVAEISNWQTQVQGTSDQLPDVRSWPVAAGAFFTAADVTRAARVVVLGSVVRDELFGADVDPVGATVRIRNQPFRVVGVLSRKGQAAMGQDQDDTVFVPYTTVQKRLLGVTNIQSILISAEAGRSLDALTAAIAAELRDRHRIQPGEEDDFTVRTMEEMATVLTATTSTMTWLLAAVAAVSLLVGGIGIMNIMLVSVTERTREIGLRLSVGARDVDVLLQFLVEAVVLSVAGGSIGIAVGGISAWLLGSVMQWPIDVTPGAVGLSFVFAVAVGVFFGFYPARKAARLNPIEALRFE